MRVQMGLQFMLPLRIYGASSVAHTCNVSNWEAKAGG